MWIFGRKANQQSTKPDVPPELRPYFDGKSFPARVRRMLSSAAPLIISLIIIAGIIAVGGWLLHNRSVTTKNEQHTTTQTQMKPLQGSPTQTTPNPESSPQSTPSPTTSQPAPTKEPTISRDTTVPTATPASPTQSTMPNTGPGTTALIAAFSAMILGMVGYYIRQLRFTHSGD